MVNVAFAAETLFDMAQISYEDMTLISDSSARISMILPALLLAVCLICFAIDFGATGVSFASMGSLVILYLLQIVYVNPVSLVSFVVMTGILIFKISR
jgi:hypothetical protein